MKSLPYMPGHEFHKGYFQHRQVCKAAIAIMGQLQKHYIQHMCKGVENEGNAFIHPTEKERRTVQVRAFYTMIASSPTPYSASKWSLHC